MTWRDGKATVNVKAVTKFFARNKHAQTKFNTIALEYLYKLRLRRVNIQCC